MNGKRYVLVKFMGNTELAPTPGATIKLHTHYDNLQSSKPRINKVVLLFSSCREAAKYAKESYCPRFRTWSDARDAAEYYSPEEIEEYFGECGLP